MSACRLHNWIIFDNDEPGRRYQMVDPEAPALDEAAHTARYNLTALTQEQAYLLCSAVESYQHLGTYHGTEEMLRKLRRIRQALKEVPRG